MSLLQRGLAFNLPVQAQATKISSAQHAPAGAGANVTPGVSPGISFTGPHWFALSTLQGMVIDVGTPHNAPASRNWWKILFALALIPAIAAAVVTWAVIRFAFSLITQAFQPRNTIRIVTGHSFLGRFVSDLAAYYLAGRFLKPTQPVPVRDYRVRDANGDDHLVRVEGYLRSGTLDIGDDVRLEGRDRNGTLVLVRGTNNTLRTQIKVGR